MNDLKLSLKGVTAFPVLKEGYRSVVIEGVKKTVSSNHNPMLELKVISANVRYPMTACMTFHDELSMRRLRQLLDDLVVSNPGVYTLEDVEAEELDHAKLVGLNIGAYLRFSDSSHRYLEVAYLCPLSNVQ